jgi:glycosyltransferase involved in cell wall biosynthesis
MLPPPAVSVVIPTKDRARMAAAAVRCAAGQQGVETEIIVVDDGSSEREAGRLAELVGASATIVRHERSLGVSRARNAGIARASTPWVAFLDDDDLWAPGKLAAQLEAAAREGAGLVHTGIVRIDGARRVQGSTPPAPPGELLRVLVAYNPIATPSSVLAATGLVRDAGGFDPRLSILADWDLWLGLAQRCAVAACPALLTAYTEHGASMSVTRQDELRAELELVQAKHAALLERYGGTLGGPRLERWIAASVRRSGRPWRAARLYAATALRHRDPGALARAGALALGPAPLAAARALRRRRRAIAPAEVAWIAEAPAA